MRRFQLPLLLLLFLFAAGCNVRDKSETTLRVEGMEQLSQALQNSAMVGLTPGSLKVGDKNIIFIPDGQTRSGQFSVQYKLYELVDGKLKQMKFSQ